MNSTPSKKGYRLEPFRWKSIIKYLLQGLLVIAPIAVTIYTIYWIVSTVDNWLPIFRQPVKDFEGHTIGYEVKNYGLGFVIVIVSVILIGYFSSLFIQSRLFSLFDKWLEKTPGVKYIYSSVRDFFEAFAGEKKKFDKPVLANVDDTDVWRVGFITQRDMTNWGLRDHLAVYIPMAYSIAGNVYILPSNRIKPITSITSSDAMKFAISGGVTHVDEEAFSEKKDQLTSTIDIA
ncbi:MAG TPA: DUF502 domain-containing protein [Chitinophagaceae bacterium]|jgi:uncharacterized membrane protein|nr:DUF502 domain-containing protein [Chitinophagaceae bacterium]